MKTPILLGRIIGLVLLTALLAQQEKRPVEAAGTSAG